MQKQPKEIELTPQLPYKNAIVTGGGGGIGSAIATWLAKQGVTVIVAGRNMDKLQMVCRQQEIEPQLISPFEGDLSKEDTVKSLFALAQERWGEIDLLVNCAGATNRVPLRTMQRFDLETMMDANFYNMSLCILEALHQMEKKGQGRIINILSSAAHRSYKGQAAYCAAKFAARSFIESVQHELYESDSNVIMQTVSPGGVDTPMVRLAGDAIIEGEWMEPDDVVQAVAYLLSIHPRAAVRELHLQRSRSKPNR